MEKPFAGFMVRSTLEEISYPELLIEKSAKARVEIRRRNTITAPILQYGHTKKQGRITMNPTPIDN